MNLRNLPESLLERIERARVKAERQFREDEKRLPGYSKPHIPGKPCPWFVRSAQARRLLINRITTEVLADAHEVTVCARNGGVKAREIDAIVETILRIRCSNLCPDPYKSMGDHTYKFLGEVKEILFGLSEWETHLNELVEALEAQAGSQDAVNRSEEPFAREFASEEPSPPDVVKDDAVPQAPLPTPGKRSTLDQTAQPSSTESVFRRTLDDWDIRYDGQKWSGKSRIGGLSLIQTLLGNPRKLFSSAALIGRELVEISDDLVASDGRSSLLRDETVRHSRTVSDVPPEVSARPVSSADRKAGKLIVDAKARREARERRDEIKKDLDLGRVPEQDIPNLQKELLDLCKYLKTGPAGQVRKDNPDQEKARRTAQNQYSRALKLLTKNDLDRLQEHLKKSITGGESYTYSRRRTSTG